MTTDFHTALGFGGPLTAAYFNTRLADLDNAVGAMKRRGLRSRTFEAGTNAEPFLVAHRGYSRSYPENTLASYKAAIAAGAKALEIDIQFSADGVPIIMHDTASISRTANGVWTGGPNDYSFAELREVDIGSYYNAHFSREGIPTLYDVFDELGGKCAFIIEMKDGITAGGSHALAANAVADVIADYGLEKYCVLASFNDIGEASGGDAWTDHGIPLLRYTGSPDADGSIAGSSVASHVAAGYSYVGISYDAPNFASAADAWGAAGATVMAWTVLNRYDRDVALAASSAVKMILGNDPLYLGLNSDFVLPVGQNIPFNLPVMPAGCTPYYLSGSARLEGVVGSQLKVGYDDGTVPGQVGWPTAEASGPNRIIVCGSLGWGGSGIGKMSADMRYLSASGDMTRWGGLDVYTDDRGHVTGAGTDGSTGYRMILRQNGDLGLYRIDASGTETSIGSAAAADLVLPSTNTITLEVTSTQVIATGNGTSVTANDTTYRNLKYCGLIRAGAGVAFNNVKRTI